MARTRGPNLKVSVERILRLLGKSTVSSANPQRGRHPISSAARVRVGTMSLSRSALKQTERDFDRDSPKKRNSRNPPNSDAALSRPIAN